MKKRRGKSAPKGVSDPYIGIEVAGYRLVKKVGEGRIGFVYRAQGAWAW